MSTRVIIGAQWGDEGKGKYVDYFSQGADLCVRFQGGANAGHTIIFDHTTFKLRLIPSGILRGASCIIGAGTVVNLDVLTKECQNLEDQGRSTSKLILDGKATLILPSHMEIDTLREAKTDRPIGTTKNGIGVAYEDRAGRVALRAEDLLDRSTWDTKAHLLAVRHAFVLQRPLDDVKSEIIAYLEYFEPVWKDKIHPDAGALIDQAFRSKQTVVIEGAQGTLLDCVHGTYPFVTSSHTLASSVGVGIGCALPRDAEIIGVSKAYCTRVGEGPFPTEETGEFGTFLREKGGEYGVVTKRSRRCGWLDLQTLRYAHRLNGFDGLAITKVDVLDDLKEVKLLDVDGQWRTFAGWSQSASIRHEQDLPENLKTYLAFIESQVGVRICSVSTGPDRLDTLMLSPGFLST